MSDRVLNTLLTERERRGWSQSRMAEAAGITRQSYAAIESGTSVPGTEVALRLARALGRGVEELFRLPEDRPERGRAVWAGIMTPLPGQPVRLTTIAGRPVAHPVGEAYRPAASAHGVVEDVLPDGVSIRPVVDPPPPADLAVVGCDPAFGLVAEALRRERGVEVAWSPRGSRAALTALVRGEAHVAGTHLLDPATGEWNGPWIRELLPFPAIRMLFTVWDQGLVVRPETVKRIATVSDLGGGSLHVLNREEGSGSRMLLDHELQAAGLDPAALSGYGTRARSHEAVAEGVAAGAADAGIATRAVATAMGLGFIPLRQEVYELVIPSHFVDLPVVHALLDVLRRPQVRAQVEALRGYDVEGMGRQVG
jgi:putative molybdopterin biosynthesis protein